MEKFKNFIKKYYMIILSIIVGIFLLYWIIFVLTPLNTMDVQDKNKIESLSNKIDSLSKTQIILEQEVQNINKEVETIDKNISKIKTDKDKTGKKYHEEINRVDKYSERELDSFFSNRYK